MGSNRGGPANCAELALFDLYLDEDSDAGGLASALRMAGVDVSRSLEAGMNGSSDSEQLTHAIRRRRVIYTSNARDFFALHADLLESGGNHPGMIIWPRSRGYSIGEQARRILRVWNSLSAPQMQNRVEFLARWGE